MIATNLSIIITAININIVDEKLFKYDLLINYYIVLIIITSVEIVKYNWNTNDFFNQICLREFDQRFERRWIFVNTIRWISNLIRHIIFPVSF